MKKSDVKNIASENLPRLNPLLLPLPWIAVCLLVIVFASIQYADNIKKVISPEEKPQEFPQVFMTDVDMREFAENGTMHYQLNTPLVRHFQTGEKFSELQPKRIEPPEFAERIELFVLNPPRPQLYEKINERAEKHFANGLVEEVKLIRSSGVKDDTNALGAHGYRRVCEYLRGERTLESAIEQTKQDVRNYAKRQLSWFRREKNALWLDGFGNEAGTREKLWKIVGRK